MKTLISEYPLDPFKTNAIPEQEGSGSGEPPPFIEHDQVYIDDYSNGYLMSYTGNGDQYANNAVIRWDLRMRDYYPRKVKGSYEQN